MRTTFLVSTIFLCFVGGYSQAGPDGPVHMSADKLAKRVSKREFKNVPTEVREFHARGTFVLKVSVDEGGNVDKVGVVRSLSGRAAEYLSQVVSAWKFRPLKVNGKPKSYSGLLIIPFCYGRFTTDSDNICDD